MTLEDSSI